MRSTTNFSITFRLWFQTYLVLNLGLVIYFLLDGFNIYVIPLSLFVFFIGGLPGLIIYWAGICVIDCFSASRDKHFSLVIFLNGGIAFLYSIPATLFAFDNANLPDFFAKTIAVTAILSLSGMAVILYNRNILFDHFFPY